MSKRYVTQLQAQDDDQWADVLYTDDKARAARLVAATVESNPQVKDGQVVDTQEQGRNKEQ